MTHRFLPAVQMLEARDRRLTSRSVELTSHFWGRNTSLRRSSYAFSHKEGYADLISRGASVRVKAPQSRARPNGFPGAPSLGKGSPRSANASPTTPGAPAERTVQRP